MNLCRYEAGEIKGTRDLYWGISCLFVYVYLCGLKRRKCFIYFTVVHPFCNCKSCVTEYGFVISEDLIISIFELLPNSLLS